MDSQPQPPPIPPNFLDMNTLIAQLFQKMERLEIDVRECHTSHKTTLEMQNGAIVRALEQNTTALNQIKEVLSHYSKKT